MFRCLGLYTALLAFPVLGSADDKIPTPDKLKDIAADGLMKAGVSDGRTVETDHLVVASGLPESRLKTVAAEAEKMYVRAHKALRFDATEVKEAKALLFLFPDVDAYRSYKRNALKERAADDEYSLQNVKGDYTLIALAPRRGDKNPKFETLAAEEVGKALLVKKAGPNARLTEWMKDGFVKAVAGRSDARMMRTERTVARRFAPRVAKGWKGGPYAVDAAWTGTTGTPAEKDAVAATLMDFLTFGIDPDKLGLVLGSLVPTDEVMDPKPAQAFLAPGWKIEELDYQYRDWLAKGSPEFKPPAEPKTPKKK